MDSVLTSEFSNGGGGKMIADIGAAVDDGGHMGPSSAYIVNAKSALEDSGHRFQYTMPGTLQFLQAEWSRFEMDRSQWLVERAELQARVAFLQGERKGQENLKQDLVRRIKMLEFALKQERARYHKLKYGSEQSPSDVREQPPAQEVQAGISGTLDNHDWFQGRQLLRQYLQDIGYTDAILGAESSRVRSLLAMQQQPAPAAGGAPSVHPRVMNGQVGMKDNDNHEDNEGRADDDDDAEADCDERAEQSQVLLSLAKSAGGRSTDEDAADEDTDEALAEFDFLVSESYESEARTAGDGAVDWTKHGGAGGLDYGGGSNDWGGAADQRLLTRLKEEYRKDRRGRKGALVGGAVSPRATAASDGSHDGGAAGVSSTSSYGLSSLHAMMSSLAVGGVVGEDDVATEAETNACAVDQKLSSGSGRASFASVVALESAGMAAHMNDEIFDSVAGSCPAGLGDLADICVNNDSALYEAIDSPAANGLKRTWMPKYTLRSHFDGIRALSFHPVEPILLTASEDHTLKLWNLQKTVPSKKTVTFDVEPVYTLRGHMGPVLCLATSGSGEQCYSGGLDATVRCWTIPSAIVDPYDSYDASVLQETLVAHTDAVWGLAVHSARMQLLSCSADGTVRLWSPGEGRKHSPPLLRTFATPSPEDGVPTSVDFLANEPNQMVAAYTSGNSYIYDLETGKIVVRLESRLTAGGPKQINKIVNHPTLPLAVAAHENCQISFYDTVSGQQTHSMVAHLDAVTTLAVDPNGLYLMSGSHDCSVRLWSLDTKTCVQEITTHRKKWEEAIFDVAFHPSKPYIASAGADGLARVYV